MDPNNKKMLPRCGVVVVVGC